MSTQIVGGRLNSPMSVGSDGRARVLSVTQSLEYNLALSELAFQVMTEVNLTDSSLTPLVYIKNTITGYKSGSEQVLCLHDFTFSANADIHFEVFVDESYTSGGTQITPINKFVGSTREAEALVYDNSSNDLVLAGDGEEIESLFIGGNTVYNHKLDGSLILRNQKSVTIKAEGANTNKCRVAINFFYVPISWSE